MTPSPTMRAIGLREFGGAHVLGLVDVPRPAPGVGDVLVRVHAVAVNPTDITFREGRRAAEVADRARPLVPGMDLAGVVVELGEGASGVAVGDSVVGLVTPYGPGGGSYAEYVAVDHRSLVRAPRGATMAESSTLLLNALTADVALDTVGLEPRAPLAVTGALGAVGGYASQLAAHRGHPVIADAPPGEEALARSLGVSLVLPRSESFAARLREEVPDGVQGLVDGANLGAGCFAAIRDGGALASVKGWQGAPPRGIRVGNVLAVRSMRDTVRLRELVRLVESGAIALRVGEVLPASRAVAAHGRMELPRRGRVVLDFDNLDR